MCEGTATATLALTACETFCGGPEGDQPLRSSHTRVVVHPFHNGCGSYPLQQTAPMSAVDDPQPEAGPSIVRTRSRSKSPSANGHSSYGHPDGRKSGPVQQSSLILPAWDSESRSYILASLRASEDSSSSGHSLTHFSPAAETRSSIARSHLAPQSRSVVRHLHPPVHRTHHRQARGQRSGRRSRWRRRGASRWRIRSR